MQIIRKITLTDEEIEACEIVREIIDEMSAELAYDEYEAMEVPSALSKMIETISAFLEEC